METLKFLFTSSFYPPFHIGGDANHVKYLAEQLGNRGHEVHVLHSLDAYRVKGKQTRPRSQPNGVYVHRIKTPLCWTAYAAYLLGGAAPVTKRFTELVKRVRPDVVHHHNVSLLGYRILPRCSKYVNLYTAHDYWLFCQRNNLLKNGMAICDSPQCFCCVARSWRPLQAWRHEEAFRRAIRDIDAVIAPSNYVRERIQPDLPVKVTTIPNFAPKPPDSIRSSGYSDFFLFSGVMEKHKGILQLMDVYKRVVGRVSQKLIIVGEGSLKDKIREFVNREKLECKVVVLEWVGRSTLYCLLKDADALIVPSVWPETSSLIALEAMSVGTPTIASNLGALPEIVNKLDVGLTYSCGDELERILLGFRGKCRPDYVKEIYENHFSPNAYLERYFQLINSAEGDGNRKKGE